MENYSPFFSLIIPTYNRADRILKTIQSALHQTYNNFEILIIDDGSTDNTQEVIKSIQDPRVRYIYQENKERGAARNTGMQHAKGYYITFLDSDDILLPYHFETVFEQLKKYNFPAVYHQPYSEIFEDGRIIFKTNVPKVKDIKKFFFTKGNFIGIVGIFIKREMASKYLFDENRILAGSEDHEFLFRILLTEDITNGFLPTTHVIHHAERSEFQINKEKVINRFLYLHEKCLKNTDFQKKYPTYQRAFSFYVISLLALYLLQGRYKKDGLKYYLLALQKYPQGAFTLRSLVIFKKLLWK